MKIFKVLTLALLLTNTSAWAACENGKPVTISDVNFCVSTFSMNWWSAFSWCESQGGHLASFQEICNMSTPTTTGWINGCIYKSSTLGTSWYSTPQGTSNALYNAQYNGNYLVYSAVRTSLHNATCIID